MSKNGDDEVTLTLVVDERDMGRVIGCDGRIANAIRSLLRVMGRETAGMSSSTSSPTSEPLAVARVMGVRGPGGSAGDVPDGRAGAPCHEKVIVEGELVAREITEAGTSKHGPVLKLEGITDRDSAPPDRTASSARPLPTSRRRGRTGGTN